MANVTRFEKPIAKRIAALNLVVEEMARKKHQVANVMTTDTEVFVFLRPSRANERLNGETCGIECSPNGVRHWYERIRRVNEVCVRIRWAVKDPGVVYSPETLRRIH